jgi:hypothetical protein
VVVVLRAHHQREIRDKKKDQHKDNITPKDISQVNGGLIIGQIYFKTLI